MLCTQGSAENQLCAEWTPCLNITITITMDLVSHRVDHVMGVVALATSRHINLRL